MICYTHQATFQFPQITKNLRLSFTSHYTLYKKLNSLPGGTEWQKDIVTLFGNRHNRYGKRPQEKLEVWFRDPVAIVKDLLRNPNFAELLVYEPRETYLDETLAERVYHEMWTGDWWMNIQVSICAIVIIISIIISNSPVVLARNFCHTVPLWCP
jgi:hypothetical protein